MHFAQKWQSLRCKRGASDLHTVEDCFRGLIMRKKETIFRAAGLNTAQSVVTKSHYQPLASAQ